MKGVLLAAVMLLGAVGSAGLTASEGSGRQAASPEASDEVSPSDNRRSGRLRFRDGPVCMCSLGMSEEDIQRSARERREQREQREQRRFRGD